MDRTKVGAEIKLVFDGKYAQLWYHNEEHGNRDFKRKAALHLAEMLLENGCVRTATERDKYTGGWKTTYWVFAAKERAKLP